MIKYLQKHDDFEKKKKKGNRPQKLHFHVTYWMFYPFSEGKAVCVLDLGFFGSWPIPTVGGICLGMFKEYGNHVGDWEHMSLYFKVDEYSLNIKNKIFFILKNILKYFFTTIEQYKSKSKKKNCHIIYYFCTFSLLLYNYIIIQFYIHL